MKSHAPNGKGQRTFVSRVFWSMRTAETASLVSFLFSPIQHIKLPLCLSVSSLWLAVQCSEWVYKQGGSRDGRTGNTQSLFIYHLHFMQSNTFTTAWQYEMKKTKDKLKIVIQESRSVWHFWKIQSLRSLFTFSAVFRSLIYFVLWFPLLYSFPRYQYHPLL